MADPVALTRKDFSSDQEVRWCPGCGDYSVLTALQLLMPELGGRPENQVFVSGIGCSSRFPYYMNTYGVHSIHGRAPAVATGVALARPDLDVWVVTGDGDGLSIGGNHLIHALRRNVNFTILLFNNQIYGLTKGQYSPTSEVGKVTKSSPFGSLDHPFNPLALALGAEASFVARTHDMDRKHMQEVFRRAHEHKGAAFVEIYQNCNVFNDGAFSAILTKDNRPEMLIELRHGEPIRFGADKDKGVRLNIYGEAEIVDIAEVGEDAVLIHDEHRTDPSVAFALSRLADHPVVPTPVGVFRAVQRPSYESEVQLQLAAAQEQRGPGDLRSLISGPSVWEVSESATSYRNRADVVSTPERAFEAWGAYERDNPFPLFAAVRALGPVHPVTLHDGHAAYLVARYAEARAALNDPRLSKDMQAALAGDGEVVAEGLPGPAFARHMLVVDPPDHTRLRRLVSAAFSNRRIEELRPHVQAVVDGLLDAIVARGPASRADLVESFAFPLPFTVICELLGVPEADRARFGRDLGTLLAPTSSPETYARAVAASEAVVAYLTALVETKQATPADDLVSGLISAARNGDTRLTQQELLSTIFQLIVAGHDTTTSLIGNGVVALLLHPDQLAALRDDPTLIPAAIEELLRYDAPVPHSTFRFATVDVELGGVTIPAGAQVIISLASADHDEDHYTNPESLLVDRAEARHLAFGHGIHFCLAAGLARMEAELAFTALLGRLPELRLAVPVEELHWAHGDGLVLRGLSELPVIPGPARPRSPARP